MFTPHMSNTKSISDLTETMVADDLVHSHTAMCDGFAIYIAVIVVSLICLRFFKSSNPSAKVGYPKPARVNKKDWNITDNSYEPVFHEDKVLSMGFDWADPANVKDINAKEWANRKEHAATKFKLFDGFPRNPRGRTGIWGRGLLGRWGPNHAADPIVTRFDPKTGYLQCLMIVRADTGETAIPGGMVDNGETVSVTLKREFMEEVGNHEDPETKKEFEKLCNELFQDGNYVYEGIVDDHRNTDNAWMETVAVHFHCSPKLAELMQFKAGTDARKVKWVNLNWKMVGPQRIPLFISRFLGFPTIHGDHKRLLKMAMTNFIGPIGSSIN